MINKWKIIILSIPPYSSELNKIEHVFERLKKNIS